MFQFICVPPPSSAIKLEEVKLSQRFINVAHEFQQGSTKYLQTDSPFTLNEEEEENGDRYSQRNAQQGRRQKAIKIIAVAI